MPGLSAEICDLAGLLPQLTAAYADSTPEAGRVFRMRTGTNAGSITEVRSCPCLLLKLNDP